MPRQATGVLIARPDRVGYDWADARRPGRAPADGSERGPVALPVFKIGRLPLTAGGLGSTPRRFRHIFFPVIVRSSADSAGMPPAPWG